MLSTIIFIGRSGCGKGTQAALLMDKLHAADGRHILYVETGERFRQFIRTDHFSAERAREINDSGGRQPDFLACWMWGNVLVEELGPDMHLVFDGAPRAPDEARVLTTALEFYRREKPTVIHLNVSRQWSEERLLGRARSDDASMAKIEKKLSWYEQSVVPALDYMKDDPRYTYIDVNGEQTVEDVHKDILKELATRHEIEI